MIIEASPLNTSFILNDLPEADQEAQQKRIRNDVLRPFDALVQFDEMIGLCAEDQDGRWERPEEAEDQLLFDVGVYEENRSEVHGDCPRR